MLPRAPSFSLNGKTALITGGGRGIGLAIARRFDAMGLELTLAGRDRAALDQAVAGLAHADRHSSVTCDVGDESAVNEMFAMLVSKQRSPQILVNNAGSASSARVVETSSAAWHEMLRVNLTGVFHCPRAALPAFAALPFARIVNIASTAGLIGYPNVAAYCAAKHGVSGFTRALALEVARTGSTVNAVCPGYTDTELVGDAVANIVAKTGKTREEARSALAARNPQKRLVAPEEVASAVAWLCLPESQSVTGQAIAVAGGEVATG